MYVPHCRSMKTLHLTLEATLLLDTLANPLSKQDGCLIAVLSQFAHSYHGNFKNREETQWEEED